MKYFLTILLLKILLSKLYAEDLVRKVTGYSETEKYLVNNHYPENTIIDFVESDFIANIRKSHYKEKYNQSDILKLYKLIKKEYLYKKLNFLAY